MSRAWAPIRVFLILVLLAGCSKSRLMDKLRQRNPDRSCAPTTGPAGAILAGAPDGYVPMTVGSVTPLRGGDARVELVSASQQVVNVFVGGTEGQSLRLRMAKRAPARPLTHDLLDRMLRELNAEVVQAQIDELR